MTTANLLRLDFSCSYYDFLKAPLSMAFRRQRANDKNLLRRQLMCYSTAELRARAGEFLVSLASSVMASKPRFSQFLISL